MLPPGSKLARVADAASEVIDLATAKSFLRLENSADDAIVTQLVRAARWVCEDEADRSFVQTTWKLTLDYLPFGTPGGFLGLAFGAASGAYRVRPGDDGGIFLPRPPLIAVTSVNYVDQGGTTRTLDPSAYIVSSGTPGRIYPAFGTLFPFSQPRPAAVDITYTAGYGTDPALVPPNVGTAILMLLTHYYAHRSEQAEISDAVANLLGPSKWGGYS